jgi:tetratricopeptide (TPR) repeat protein
VYVALEKPAEALPLLEQALQAEPRNGLIWVDAGRAYRALGESAKAVAAFEKAIELGERKSSVYYQLALAARKTGDVERSRQALAASERLRSEEKPAGLVKTR